MNWQVVVQETYLSTSLMAKGWEEQALLLQPHLRSVAGGGQCRAVAGGGQCCRSGVGTVLEGLSYTANGTFPNSLPWPAYLLEQGMLVSW